MMAWSRSLAVGQVTLVPQGEVLSWVVQPTALRPDRSVERWLASQHLVGSRTPQAEARSCSIPAEVIARRRESHRRSSSAELADAGAQR